MTRNILSGLFAVGSDIVTVAEDGGWLKEKVHVVRESKFNLMLRTMTRYNTIRSSQQDRNYNTSLAHINIAIG